MNKITVSIPNDNQKSTLEKLISFDFIRAVCALGIIVYHFSIHLTENAALIPLTNFSNGHWGCVFVTIFFLLSGALLYYNYPQINSKRELKYFYYKRWKSIYPSFYLAFFYFFIQAVRATGQIFYLGKRLPFLLSLLGIDGYFAYLGDNYYQIGEWFLGAIILLYLFYPIILYLFNHSDKLTLGGIFLAYLLVLCSNYFQINDFRNLFSCMLSFLIGMELIKYRGVLKNRILFLVSALGAILLLFISFPIPFNASEHLLGFFLLVLLYWAGEVIMKYVCCREIFSWIGSISYPIFLLQHTVILHILAFHMPTTAMDILTTLGITILFVLIEAYLLSVLTKGLLHNTYFLKLENKVMQLHN